MNGEIPKIASQYMTVATNHGLGAHRAECRSLRLPRLRPKRDGPLEFHETVAWGRFLHTLSPGTSGGFASPLPAFLVVAPPFCHRWCDFQDLALVPLYSVPGS